MKIPVSWLKDFVEINISTQELADKLVSCGFEIEEIIDLKDNLQNIVTSKIIDIKKHENANKLFVCKVDIGEKIIQIVTAATNIAIGDIVPGALDGALLADGTTISASEMRGILSEGMFCSGAELDITESDFTGAGVDGILILPKDTPLGVDINEVIGNDEMVLDIDITANRQDCNSILGIAREIAVVTNQKVKMPNLNYNESKFDINDAITVENSNYELCPRYMAKLIKDIKIEQSPTTMRNRLRAVGIRPINNLVDVTNYVLIEIGQPLHAFDLDLLEGNKIVVRTATKDESIVALDGKKYKLSENNLAICDAVKPIAIAGIMGGEYSSVNENTTDIIMESAKFARDSIRHTSRGLNLRSESSQRFEKGIDFGSQEMGLNRVLSIIDQYGWGKVASNEIDKKTSEVENKVVSCNYNDINAILGIIVPKDKIVSILNSLELDTKVNGEILTVTLPVYRDDIVGVNDLAEEVIRIYGYDNITPTLLKGATMVQGGKNKAQKRMDKIKSILVSHGCYEIVSYSFIPPKAFDMLLLDEKDSLRDAIKLQNPIGIDFSVMRTTLAFSIIKTMAANIQRDNKNGRFFEIAKTYIPKALPLTELPTEEYALSIGIYGENEDFYSIKSVLKDLMNTFSINLTYKRSQKSFLHPGRSADLFDSKGNCVGYIGETHPDVAENFDAGKKLYIAEINAKFIIDNAIDQNPFQPMSKYQGMERDLALIMSEDKPVKEVTDIIIKNGGDILEDVEVFDVYVGNQVPKGQKSVAIKLNFRHINRTLVDEEVNAIIANILKSLEVINAKLR